MAERKWPARLDLVRLLPDCLAKGISERKVRLFVCACYRQAWPLLDGATRRAVKVSERYVDREAGWRRRVNITAEEPRGAWLVAAQSVADRLTRAVAAAGRRAVVRSRRPAARAAAEAVRATRYDLFDRHFAYDGVQAAMNVVGALAHALAHAAVAGTSADDFGTRVPSWSEAHDGFYHEARRRQAGLLEDLAGELFRPPVFVRGSWLDHDGGLAFALARCVYGRRAFDRLPVLADALEDAGCDHAGLLEHLRSPGPHVRGCWALDSILGGE